MVLLGAARAETLSGTAEERGRNYFEGGRQAYEAGDYQSAVAAFEEAFRLVPKPQVAFALAQAHRKQFVVDNDTGKLKRAVTLYRKYLAEVPQGGRRDEATQHVQDLMPLLSRAEAAGPIAAPIVARRETRLMIISPARGATASIDGERGPVPLVRPVTAGIHKIQVEADGHFPESLDGAAVEGELVVVKVDLRPRPALLSIRAPSGAAVAVDGRAAGETPLAAPLAIPAGRRFVTVTKRGHRPFARELDLTLGQTTTLDAALETTGQRKLAFWVLVGGGALLVGGGVTTTLAFIQEGKAQDIDDRRRTMNISLDEVRAYERHVARRDDLRLASTLLFGGAAACALTGTLLWLIDSPRPEAPPSGGTIVPVIAPDELGAAYLGTF